MPPNAEPAATTTLESFGPMEVVVVAPRKSGAEGFYRMLIRYLLLPLDALLAMLAVPLAHRVLGTPQVHPGYWSCLLLLLLFDLIFTSRLHPSPRRAST